MFFSFCLFLFFFPETLLGISVELDVYFQSLCLHKNRLECASVSSVADMCVVCLAVASVLSVYLLIVCDDILTVKTPTSHFVYLATVIVDIHTQDKC